MNWYYVENGAQAGPISETDLEALKQSGRIQHDTLVWREGLSEWQPYHQAVPFSASTGLPPISAVALPVLMYHAVEAPLIAFGSRLVQGWRKPEPVLASPG